MKKLFKISFYTIIFGWFIFMWLCLYGYRNPEIVEIIAFTGFFICVVACAVFVVYFRGAQDVFKSIEELEEEREKFRQAYRDYYNTVEELRKIISARKNK